MLRMRSIWLARGSTFGVRRRERTNDSADRTLIAECFGGIAVLAGRAAPALSPRLGQIARREHARRSIEITIESFGIAPHGAPAHVRGQFDP